jgi:hypothetical protein
MAQHHTSEISTIAVFTTIIVLFGFSIFHISSGFNLTDLRNAQYAETLESVERIAVKSGNSSLEVAKVLFENDPNILMLYSDKSIVHHKLDTETFENYYDSEDYTVISRGNVRLFVSHIDINKEIALEHIQSFFIIVFIVLAFMIIYTRHFVQNITDILHVMEQGFRKKDYNLQVKIKEEFSDHEINHIASFYNDRYLPAKLQKIEKMKQKTKSGLSMNDFLNLTGSNNKQS